MIANVENPYYSVYISKRGTYPQNNIILFLVFLFPFGNGTKQPGLC